MLHFAALKLCCLQCELMHANSGYASFQCLAELYLCLYIRLVFKCVSNALRFPKEFALFRAQRYVNSCYASSHVLVISLA